MFKSTEVFLGLLKKHDPGPTGGLNAICRTFKIKTMTTATSTAFLQQGENNEDDGMDVNTKKGLMKHNFFFFMDCFGSSVCGYSRFNETKKGQQLFSNACTVSDEAFAILLLRKNWNTWEKRALDDVCTSEENRVILETRDTDTEDEADDILPVYASNKTNKKFQGWHLSAITEYNQHFNNVQAARKTGTRKAFEKEYQQSKSSAYTCSWREPPTIPSLPNTSLVFASVAPCNELNVVSDWSSGSNDAVSDFTLTQDSHDTTDTHTNTAAV